MENNKGNFETYLKDIDWNTFYWAYCGTSFDPEKRGESCRREYAETLAEIYKELEAEAEKGGTSHLLAEEWERFHSGYSKRYKDWLNSKSRCMSVMIAGPSNFPVRQQEKRGNIERRRGDEITEYQKRAITAIKRTLRPELAPIMTGDADALERLTEKLATAEKNQEDMKTINAFMRKEKDTEKRIQFLKDKGISGDFLKQFYIDGDGVPRFSLTNNGAEIRRLKGRIEEIKRNHEKKEEEATSGNGIKFISCPAENRVRLFFPGKPSPEIITDLKKSGFRWTPSLGCWQAYCKPWNITKAKQLAGIVD